MKTPSQTDNEAMERAIANDLDKCDAGMALTKGATRRKYAAQRRACFNGLRELNEAQGMGAMTDAELLRELGTS